MLDVGQLREVAGAFQIEVGGTSSLGDLEGQRRLAHLADAGEDDRRHPVQQTLDGRAALAWYHPCTPPGGAPEWALLVGLLWLGKWPNLTRRVRFAQLVAVSLRRQASPPISSNSKCFILSVN